MYYENRNFNFGHLLEQRRCHPARKAYFRYKYTYREYLVPIILSKLSRADLEYECSPRGSFLSKQFFRRSVFDNQTIDLIIDVTT